MDKDVKIRFVNHRDMFNRMADCVYDMAWNDPDILNQSFQMLRNIMESPDSLRDEFRNGSSMILLPADIFEEIEAGGCDNMVIIVLDENGRVFSTLNINDINY